MVSTNDVWAAAKSAAQQIGVPAEWLYAQWDMESGGFKSTLATSNNNLGGIRNPGGTGWASFPNVTAYGQRYAQLITQEYPNARNAKTLSQYIEALSHHKGGGSYYGTESWQSYYSKVQGRLPAGTSEAAGGAVFSPEWLKQQTPVYQKTQIKQAAPETATDKMKDWIDTQRRKLYGLPDKPIPTTDEIIKARQGAGLPLTYYDPVTGKTSGNMLADSQQIKDEITGVGFGDVAIEGTAKAGLFILIAVVAVVVFFKAFSIPMKGGK